MLRLILNMVALILASFGVLWIAQGRAFVSSGFVVGQGKWAIIGVLVLVAAIVLLLGANRKKA